MVTELGPRFPSLLKIVGKVDTIGFIMALFVVVVTVLRNSFRISRISCQRDSLQRKVISKRAIEGPNTKTFDKKTYMLLRDHFGTT